MSALGFDSPVNTDQRSDRGYDFKPHESKYPNEVFGPFVKTALQRVASGWRVSYHALANDLEGVNFSSIRSGTLDERDRWSSDQQWFIDILLKRVRAEWMLMSLLATVVAAEPFDPRPCRVLVASLADVRVSAQRRPTAMA